MGFWDSLGEAVGKELSEQKKRFDSAQNIVADLSDDQLINRYKSETSMARRMAYANELKRRGII